MARALVAYGKELELHGDAQVGGSFTGDPSADALLEEANAFLFGVLFTQGIPAERAWSGPFLLRQRLGTIDPVYLATHPGKVRDAVQTPPMLHRFKETVPRWLVSAARRLVDAYDSDAAGVWRPGSHVVNVIDRLCQFDGIGRKKAVMAVELLTRHFGVELVGREYGQVAYDVQVRRVFLRSGMVEEDSRAAVEAAAAAAHPSAPGTLDLPAWLIGRQTCRPRAPMCGECRIGAVCLRRTWLNPQGVGAVRRRGQ